MKLLSHSLFTLIVCSLVGCGIAKNAEDTLDQVKSTNQKMDQTNQKIEQTNQKMDVTNAGIDKTNAAIHTQTLSVALNSMLASENTEVLTPPTDIIPFAKKFGEEASAEEILQTFHLLYTSVMKGFDAEASGDKKIQRRRIRLTAASALAAMASEEKAKEILDSQIGKEGEYFDTAFVFAMCRYNFTRDYLLKPTLDPNRTPTLKLLEKAAEHYKVVKTLATYDQVGKLAACPAAPAVSPVCRQDGAIKLMVPEFIVKNKDTNEVVALEDTLNPLEFKGLGRAAVRKFDDKNNPKMQSAEAQALIGSFK